MNEGNAKAEGLLTANHAKYAKRNFLRGSRVSRFYLFFSNSCVSCLKSGPKEIRRNVSGRGWSKEVETGCGRGDEQWLDAVLTVDGP